MTTLSKDAILGANDIKTEVVSIPEWGGSVRVSVMSGLARDAFMAMQEGKASGHSVFQAHLLAATLVSDDGSLIFTEADIGALRAKSRVVLDKLVDVALRINGMTVTAIEDAEKNSDAAQSGDSGSGSPSPSENQ